jgi:hypothetical protein
MPATVITATPTADELPSSGGGLYNEIEVPGDYEVRLEDVENYDKGDDRKGWIFIYSCETPSGGSVEFKSYLSFSKKARWKIFDTFDAHGSPSAEDTSRELDPNALIGSTVGAFIDYPRDKSTGEPTSQYRGIEKIFALADESAIEASTPTPVDLEAEAPATI